MVYIFDVDGTLTPSRGTIEPTFKDFFMDFAKNNNVVLITGSDKAKTIEQLGEDLYNTCSRVYNCSGNDVYTGNVQLKSKKFTLPEEEHNWLSIELMDSKFPLRTGLHFEHRNGLVNFSIVGRNATLAERQLYVKFDKKHKERERIAGKFNQIFNNRTCAFVGGETGIDIFARGGDKSQILADYQNEIDEIRFFGDRCDPLGNDYPLAILLKPEQVNHVTDWKDTWDRLCHDTGEIPQ
tara:strand:+ start:1454 stop:2167 length:714 start_codon:yes stop_codon:yes gene_type:complete